MNMMKYSKKAKRLGYTAHTSSRHHRWCINATVDNHGLMPNVDAQSWECFNFMQFAVYTENNCLDDFFSGIGSQTVKVRHRRCNLTASMIGAMYLSLTFKELSRFDSNLSSNCFYSCALFVCIIRKCSENYAPRKYWWNPITFSNYGLFKAEFSTISPKNYVL